jgi:hypothetical protein
MNLRGGDVLVVVYEEIVKGVELHRVIYSRESFLERCSPS